MAQVQKISPCLWFDSEAEDAAKFYTGIFENSKIVTVTRYGNAGQEVHGRKPGSVMTVDFVLEGQQFTALNGGPHFKFNEAISLQVLCATQDELDHYWTKLNEGGDPKAQQCGWLKDQFGLSWQIIPQAMNELMTSGTPEQIDRTMNAMLEMKKLDLAALKKAHSG